MATLTVINAQGKDAGTVDVSDAVFGADINMNCVRQALNVYLNNQRQGNAKVKSRGEVRGGGAKPWRQKGTGRARAGTNRSPLWRGGSVIFGPQPRSYRQKVNKKVRRGAIRSVLTSRAQESAITVLDDVEFESNKTREIASLLETIGAEGKTLIVTGSANTNLQLGARNLPKVKVEAPENLNVYNLLGHEKLVLDRDALSRIEEMFGDREAVK